MFTLSGERFRGSEDKLVQMFLYKYAKHYFLVSDDWVKPVFYEQVRVPEVNRISDLIVRRRSTLINIEFKLTDYEVVLRQATDHLGWADYSIICMPSNVLASMPTDVYTRMIARGIGFIAAGSNTFLEVIKPKYNTYAKKKVRKKRQAVAERVKSHKVARKF